MTHKARLTKIEKAARQATGARPRTFVYYGTTADGQPIENPAGNCDGQPMTLAEWRTVKGTDDIEIVICYRDEQPQSTITEGRYTKILGIDAGAL